MSLQHTAKHLANQGRGKDTMLVHMTPREVGGLQALAMAQGGSLSVNPDTGLPEAGFLDNLLPMIIGGGLMAMTGGAAAPAVLGMSMPTAIGLGVGGLQTLRTGDLGKGIMAGLGAYGGAGLGAGLLGAGASSTAAEMAGGLQGASAGELAAAQQGVAQNAAQATMGERLATMGKGVGALGSEAGRAGFMSGVGGGSGLLKTGLAAAGPVMSAMEEDGEMPRAKGSGPNPYRYRFERGEADPFPEASPTGVERMYFPNARYVAYAGGGAVEAMSDANAVGANTGFPMADIQRGAYATPYQQPISQNVVTGASDTRVDPYTGAERLAEGGTVKENSLLDSPYAYKNDGQSGGESFSEGSPSLGSPTGSVISDIGFGLSGLQGAPGSLGVIGSLAGALMDSFSTVSPSSPNAINGLDLQSDIATAANMSNAPSVATEAQTAEAIAAALSDAIAAGATATGTGTGTGGGMGGSTGAGTDGGTGDAATAVSDGGGGADAGVSGGVDGGVGAGGLASGGVSRLRYAPGGLSDLGSYSDGGRLLRGPGDGVSDSIPAVIGGRQPARLADGEFVVPARIVSELGNGSTEAGARKLYAMMDRIQKARSKTVGKGKVAKNTRADKSLPA